MDIWNIVMVLLAIWALPWKLYSVWLAVKRNQKKWFVALILLNTLAILDIYYIFYVAKKSWAEVKHDFLHGWTLAKNSVKRKKE